MKNRAAEMANAFVEELDRINREVVMTSGGRTRVFLDRRIAEAKGELAKAETGVKVFQETNGAIKLDDQSKAIIEAIGTLKGQIIAREVELQTLLSYTTPSNPKAQILKKGVEELNTKLRELESGKGLPAGDSRDVFIPTAKLPGVGLQYARLLRDVTVQETLYQLLTQQYEVARVQEAKDSPIVQVLDVAKVPEKKAKPKRTLMVAIATAAATGMAIFIAFILEGVERVKIQGHTERVTPASGLPGNGEPLPDPKEPAAPVPHPNPPPQRGREQSF
ncbi:MAG: hypothetical protein HY760_04170 [Nitrospirae bacterium]|nr:hypothetical protein [Nitrospirota bacterium]